MPPRFAYWTIILDGAPTSFRTKEREDILPLFNQLKAKNPAALLKWFSGGRLWDSPEQAKDVRNVEKVRRFREERSKETKEQREAEDREMAAFREKHGRPADGSDQRHPLGRSPSQPRGFLRLARRQARSGQVSPSGGPPVLGPARGVPPSARQASGWQRSGPACASGLEPGLGRPRRATGAETRGARPRRTRPPRQGLAAGRRTQGPARQVQAAARRSTQALEGSESGTTGPETVRQSAARGSPAGGPPVRQSPSWSEAIWEPFDSRWR